LKEISYSRRSLPFYSLLDLFPNENAATARLFLLFLEIPFFTVYRFRFYIALKVVTRVALYDIIIEVSRNISLSL